MQDEPFSRTTQSPCFESGFVYFELNTSPDFFRVRVRVFLESGFSSSPGPSPSPVRVSKYAFFPLPAVSLLTYERQAETLY